MNVTVREFISTNNNNPTRLKINGDFYRNEKYVPEYLLDRYVSNWEANFWDAIIEIITE